LQDPINPQNLIGTNQITIKRSCKCWTVIDLFAWLLWTSLFKTADGHVS